MACYDFPEVVIHDPSYECGRYKKGGVCRPLPTPVEPYTEEERVAAKGYEMFQKMVHGEVPEGMKFALKEALGETLYPPEGEFHD